MISAREAYKGKKMLTKSLTYELEWATYGKNGIKGKNNVLEKPLGLWSLFSVARIV